MVDSSKWDARHLAFLQDLNDCVERDAESQHICMRTLSLSSSNCFSHFKQALISELVGSLMAG